MNFRKAYKEANDEIKGDRSILDNLGEKSKAPKTIRLHKVYAFAGCAAALVIVCAVTALPDFLGTDKNLPDTIMESVTEEHKVNGEAFTEDKQSEEPNIASKDMPKTDKEDESILETGNCETYSKKTNTYDYNNEIKAYSASDSAAKDSGVSYEADEEISRESENSVTDVSVFSARSLNESEDKSAEKNEAQEELKDNTVNAEEESKQEMPVGSGGSGVLSRSIYNESPTVTAEEFFILSGIDKSKLELEGFTLTIPEKAEVILSDNGDNYYKADFYLSDGAEKSINVTISTQGGETKFSIYKSGNTVSAVCDTGDKKISVSAVNVSEDTVSDYVERIK